MNLQCSKSIEAHYDLPAQAPSQGNPCSALRHLSVKNHSSISKLMKKFR